MILIDLLKIITVDLGHHWEKTEKETETETETETNTIAEKEGLGHHMEEEKEPEIVIAEIVVEHQKEVIDTDLALALPYPKEVRLKEHITSVAGNTSFQI